MDIIDTIQGLSVARVGRRSLKDDDFLCDRLHHRYTVALLVIFCAVISTSQYAGDPINCWVPAQFTGSFETYTNRLCWLQNTYYVDENHDIPDDMAERDKTELKYYQWIHLIILVQAVLFIVPRVFWQSLNDKCGIEIRNYVDAAYKFETVEEYNERDKLMDFLSGHINTFIRSKSVAPEKQLTIKYKIKRFFRYIFFWTGKRFGNYLIILYVFVKIFYLANVFGQLFLMTKLLGIQNYHFLGFEILQRMASGQDMIANHYFPKVSHCDFKVRELGNDHQYTVQCVLTINIFVEKMYIIIWFWFVILTVITLFDMMTFIYRNCFNFNRVAYIKKHLLVFGTIENDQKKLFNVFVREHLKPDVVLVFRLLANNVNGMVVSELVKKVWDKYCESSQMEMKVVQNAQVAQDDTDVFSESDGSENVPKFPIENRTKLVVRVNGKNKPPTSSV